MTEEQVFERLPVKRDPLYWCWLWGGKLDKDGYGRHGDHLAHKYVYQELVAPVLKGMMLDHRCRRRNCVNPNHLEPVDQHTNERRKSWRHRVRKMTHCQAGHELRWHGRLTPTGGKVCRECK